jgi:hypothetical protein
MIHHCGSGTYQYQIKHLLPAICVGSQCFDRDDVAMRLQELGVARYIPAPEEADGFVDQFRKAFDACSDPASLWYQTARKRLQAIKRETDRGSAEFGFEEILERTRASHSEAERTPATSVGQGRNA